jgi:hypothetical protein
MAFGEPIKRNLIMATNFSKSTCIISQPMFFLFIIYYKVYEKTYFLFTYYPPYMMRLVGAS